MTQATDPDEANTNSFNPLVPRPIDRSTVLPPDGVVDPEIGDIAKIFAAPEDPASWPRWRRALNTWRTDARARLGYSGSAYDDARFSWARNCYNVALVWLWDERLFDHAAQRFTVDCFLDHCAVYGGLDGVVLWHAYPVIGIDDRNQFDYYRQVPGIADVFRAFKSAGVRTFINYNPWDTGTRRTGRQDPEELAELVRELGVDGVFLDTMKEGGTDLIGALQGTDPPQVLEGESRIQLTRIEDHLLSWAQWFADSEAPGVLRAHWYEQRHMMHHTRRWNRDHSAELQSSFMNGTGMLIWDAVFGAWVGWNTRDQATLRAMVRIQRALADLLATGVWTPLTDAVPSVHSSGIYVSRFSSGTETLWTVINRSDTDFRGAVLDPSAPTHSGAADLTGGSIMTTTTGTVTVPARGIAAVYGWENEAPDWLEALLAENRNDQTAKLSAALIPLPQRRVEPHPSRSGPPPGALPLTPGARDFTVAYRRRETGIYFDAPYVEEWKPLPPRLHDARQEVHAVAVGMVAVARREVARTEFEAFVDQTGYRRVNPATPVTERTPPDTPGDPGPPPATMVGLQDARSYAAWAGARLPTEFEWQAAAEQDGFEYLQPRVWNWTNSEHSDTVTRFAILKGGSHYTPHGSDWYFDGGPREPDFSAKLLLTGLGMDCSPAIGFRLAWDIGGSDE